VKPQVFLSADVERDLALRYRQGDEKAGHTLACAYLPLVKRIAGEFFGSREDLVSEGCVGLMKAIRRYDPDHGARLGSYAVIWIEAEIREFTLRQVRMESLNEPAGEAGIEKIHLLADEREDQEQALADADELRARLAFLERALNSLPDRERQIIVERHLRHQATPLKDLGVRYGLSGESIRQMELKALNTLKTMRGMAAA
jgi:RNA polymerase sigma factor (sigma-70 family)